MQNQWPNAWKEYQRKNETMQEVEKSLKSGYKSFKSGIWSILDIRERSKQLVGL